MCVALDLERSPLGAVRQNDQVFVEDLDRNGDSEHVEVRSNPVHRRPGAACRRSGPDR